MSQLRERVIKELDSLDVIYEKLSHAVNQSGEVLSRTDFDWAYAVCKTRMVDASGVMYETYQEKLSWVQLRTRHDNSVLAPVFDMINHSNRPNCDYWYDVRTGVLKINLMRDVKPGTQLFIDYGPRPDDYLFQCYGFCLKPGDNEMNRIDIQMSEICDASKHVGIDDFWGKVNQLELYVSADKNISADLSVDYDKLWINLNGIDGGLWTMLVWLSDGDFSTTASFTHNGVDFMTLPEIETRQKCIDILIHMLKARLLDMKENDAKMRAKIDRIDPFTVKIMRNIRMSHSDIIFLWWVY